MPAITPHQWEALRAEWETGQGGRALSRKYGLSEAAIRNRARDEAWERDTGASERIHERAQALTLAALAPAAEPSPAKPPTTPHHAPPSAADPANPANPANPLRTPSANPAQSQAGRAQTSREAPGPGGQNHAPVRSESLACARDPLEEARRELREISIEEAAKALAAAQLGQLDRARAIERAFTRISELVAVGLEPVDPADEEGVRRQSIALSTLLAGGNSSTLSTALTAWVKMGESIQTQERRALGAEDRPKQVQLSGPKGGPIQTETTVVGMPKGPDLKKMSLAQLELLLAAADLMAGQVEAPPLAVPPSDPADCVWLPRPGEYAGEEGVELPAELQDPEA